MSTKIHLLDFGHNDADNSIFIAGESPGKKVQVPIIGCYIDHPDVKILVDSGVSDTKQPLAIQCKYSFTPQNNVKSQLAKLGTKLEDIDCVVATHLHWDHTGGIRLFPKAKVFVRREELREAFVPAQWGDKTYHRPDFSDEDIPWELLPNDIDVEIAQGVTLLSVPGHTAGTQSVLVQTAEGPVICASDSVYWYRSWNELKLPGICFSVESWLKSVAKMKAVRGATLIPGHEPSIDHSRVYG